MTEGLCEPEWVVLAPLKGFNNSIGSLRERYTEDTADVFFVDKETKERLPAHREVLKVASAVFFKMFNGDWKERGQKEIPAPEEYNWESFKAAITLLYGEEVEVEEDSVVDIYRVAHCYDLGEVLHVIIHEISKLDDTLLDIALELCIAAPEEEELMEAVVKIFARNLEKVKENVPLEWSSLPYNAMLMLVQSDDISAPEVTLLDLLNEWTEGQSEISLENVRDLYGHIRYGIVPYENFLSCVTHNNLFTVFQMHQCMSIDQVKENVIQLTPRPLQKDVFQVYPMTSDLTVAREKGKWEFLRCKSSRPIGVIYTGQDECSFEIDFGVELTCSYPTIACELTSIYQEEKPKVNLRGRYAISSCHILVVTLNSKGAHIMTQGREKSAKSGCVSEKLRLTCSGAFPWLFQFESTNADRGTLSITVRHPI